jgi:hypothetical protein
MNQDVDKLIENLGPAMDRKCAQLAAARRERLQARGFVALCVLALLLPAAFVLLGFSLMILVVPVLFLAAGVIVLMPLLIEPQGGHRFEHL